MNELQQETANRLLAIGATQDEEVKCAFWFNSHCLYIREDGSVDEL